MKIVAISVLLLVISSVNVDGLSVETNSDGFTITFANLPVLFADLYFLYGLYFIGSVVVDGA